MQLKEYQHQALRNLELFLETMNGSKSLSVAYGTTADTLVFRQSHRDGETINTLFINRKPSATPSYPTKSKTR